MELVKNLKHAKINKILSYNFIKLNFIGNFCKIKNTFLSCANDYANFCGSFNWCVLVGN